MNPDNGCRHDRMSGRRGEEGHSIEGLFTSVHRGRMVLAPDVNRCEQLDKLATWSGLTRGAQTRIEKRLALGDEMCGRQF
jgi:hypothetical protein